MANRLNPNQQKQGGDNPTLKGLLNQGPQGMPGQPTQQQPGQQRPQGPGQPISQVEYLFIRVAEVFICKKKVIID